MPRELAQGSDSGPPPAILRTAADINQLIARLFILWQAPRIEVHLEALPPLHVQHTQQRLEQLHERTIGSWGEIAAGVALLAGSFHAWTKVRQWHQMGIVLATVVAVWLAGQLLEAMWRRGRLIWSLWRLRRQLVTGKGLYQGSTQPPSHPEYDSAVPGRGAVAPSAMASTARVFRESPRQSAGQAESHPKVLLIALASDIDPVLRQLAVPRRLPRIELRLTGLTELDLQRTQHRVTRLAESCNCVLGALFAAATLLAGGFYIIMTRDQFWEWLNNWDAGPGATLAASVVGAGIAGWLIEAVVTRLRLAAVLLGLRRRLRAQADAIG